ncbi:VOC family protein [Nocardioides panaciterrulae]|uniref:Putative enzyme related to lactoylglutathione lyase n=1 Tax=Nocardioides panaciterrulae TaxID=661492 RepID=A0A7Y9E8N1_9ACTN|nr:VOC family protein [Nocardioides panaciterrulae]NYD43200.1 putative enzyme related to lactoylglutathione lyase [Nocardioides panaciterrulae]
MASRIRNTCIDCADPYALALFWSRVLGVAMDPEDAPGADEAGFDVEGGRSLLFLRVPEPKATKNRLHLCLEPQQQQRDQEVARLLDLGATLWDDQRRPDGTGWAVLQDPEGNEFCVLRSEAERSDA